MYPQSENRRALEMLRPFLRVLLAVAACVFGFALFELFNAPGPDASAALLPVSALFLAGGLVVYFFLSRASQGFQDPAETGDFTKTYIPYGQEPAEPLPAVGWALAGAVLVLVILISATCYDWARSARQARESARAWAMALQRAKTAQPDIRAPAPVPVAVPGARETQAADPGSTAAPETREPQTPDEPEQTATLASQARDLIRAGDFKTAESLYRQRIKILHQMGGNQHAFLAVAYSDLARTLYGQKKLDEAEVYFHQAMAACEKAKNPDGDAVADSMAGLVALYRAQGRKADAARLNTEAARVRRLYAGKSTARDQAAREIRQDQPDMEDKRLAPSPSYGDDARASSPGITPRTSSTTDNVRLRDFELVQSVTGGIWIPRTDSVHNLHPREITKEPAYKGTSQRYGYLKLGTRKNNVFRFVFDLVRGPHPILYFDTNQNGDLTDDGGPITNQGSGVFAAQVSIPFNQIADVKDITGDFLFWIYTTESQWDHGFVSHYSLSRFRSHLVLGGGSHLAYVMDTAKNDGDFTNDGIFVDANGDGKIQEASEWFRPGQPVVIQGKEYSVDITW